MTQAQVKYNKVFARLGHECEMVEEEDEIDNVYPGNSVRMRIKRFFLRHFLISEKMCKSCTIYLRSHGAITRERRRQLRDHPHIIHPFSAFRISWDIFMVNLCLIQLVILPLDLAYGELHRTFPFFSSMYFRILRTICDLLMCVDVVLNAFTGYYDDSKKEIVLKQSKILLNYLKTTLILDVLASFPNHFDLFFSIPYYRPQYMVVQCFSALTMLRYYTFVTYIKKLASIFNVNFYLRQSFLLSMSILLYWHFLSCLQLFGWLDYSYRLETSRLDRIGKLEQRKVFAENLYHGALLIYTATYGAQQPDSNIDYFMISVAWFVSKYIQVFFLARMIEFLRAHTSPKQKYSQMVKQLTEFMRHKQLPIYTQRRILKYYEFHFQKRYFRENEIYATISGQLRQEIVMQTCKQLVENVEFFRNLPLNLLVRIVSCLKSEVYLTNDVVVRANTPGNAMYFISTGTVAVYTNTGKEVCHLEDGAHFGEIALVMKDELRVASVIAVEVCELFRLDRKDFVKAIHPYPDLLDKIQRIAADRMEKTIMLDEHNKREMAAKRL